MYYSSVGKPKEEWCRGAPLYYSSVGKPKEEWCRGAPLYYSSVGKPKEEWCRGAPLYYSSVCVPINADLLVHVWRRGTYMSAIDSNHMIYMGTKFSHIPIIHVHNHQTYPLQGKHSYRIRPLPSSQVLLYPAQEEEEFYILAPSVGMN